MSEREWICYEGPDTNATYADFEAEIQWKDPDGEEKHRAFVHQVLRDHGYVIPDWTPKLPGADHER